MGHMKRATVQKRRIDELFNYVNNQVVETSVCIVMDYKMKLEPMCFSESSLQWFGRRGISWNGSVVLLKPLTNEREETNREENDIDSDNSSDRVDNYDDMKDVEQDMKLGMVCVDHIVETNNKEDRVAVCNIF